MPRAGKRPPGHFRIIAGRWRGRKIPILDQPGLRPTPDRVRETLFNWLAPTLPGSDCLDLFAGAGALGLEAASRGAARVVMVDHSRSAIEQLAVNVARLEADSAELVLSDALAYLRGAPQPFDVVFLDPPYGVPLLEPALALLVERWVTPESRIYIEHAVEREPPELPEGWIYRRSKRTRQVGYHLVQHR
ncbi:MAG: 16S rRNA (guanine(966)-N(2))-methyltransferase RsmD [Gammaproteobacteria bacterium]